MIVLILDFSAPTGGDNSEFVDECRQVLKTLLKDAQLAGFGTIQTSSSAWTRSHVHPKVSSHSRSVVVVIYLTSHCSAQEVARQVGVAITESDLAILHHPQLFLRPILAMEDYIDHVVDYVVKGARCGILVMLYFLKSLTLWFVANASLRSFAVLPGFVESDFWFPMIVLKVSDPLLCAR